MSTGSQDDGAELYQAIQDFIQRASEAGMKPDRVVVPGRHWDAVKRQHFDGSDGGHEVTVDGVTLVWSNRIRGITAEVAVDVGGDDER